MQPLAAVDVVANAALGFVANILRAGVDTQHQDRARSLLARVGIVAVADGPARGFEDRAIQIVDEAHERTLGRVAYGVVAEP